MNKTRAIFDVLFIFMILLLTDKKQKEKYDNYKEV